MSLNSICELMIKSALPKGQAWRVKPGGNYDKVLQATGEILGSICERMENARYVRNPKKTFVLEDLEREFGILKNNNLSESERRTSLDAKKNQSPGGGTATDLQNALDNAGFDLQVHKNNPSVDPALFLTQNFQMVAGGFNAYAGRPDAFASILGGELLVNGSVFDQEEAYISQANGASMFAGNTSAVSGRFDGLKRTPIEYTVPTDPDTWGFVFFVGGDATRDVDGKLTKIEQGEVEATRQAELNRLILSIKPLFTWAGLIITFI